MDRSMSPVSKNTNLLCSPFGVPFVQWNLRVKSQALFPKQLYTVGAVAALDKISIGLLRACPRVLLALS